MLKLPDRALWKTIGAIILPICLQNLLMHIDVVIDSVMLGQISQSALASVSLAGQVQFIYNMLMGTVSGGLSIFVAQYWGKKDTRMIDKLLGLSIQITMAVSLIFFLINIIFPRQAMQVFTNEPEFIDLGSEYLRVLSISYFFLALNMGLSIVCRCSGHVKELLWISMLTIPLDIVTNYLFIYGIRGHFAFGVTGAAIATVLVRLIALAMTYAEFKREKRFHIRWLYLRYFSVSLFKYVAKYAAPILGNSMCYGIGVVAASIIIGHLPPDAVAANSVTRVIINATLVFISGFFSGVAIIIGNLLGAGKLAEARDTDDRLLTLSVLFSIPTILLMMLAIPYVHWFAKLTPEAAELTRWMLVISIPATVGKAFNAVIFSTLNTGGESKTSFRLDLIITVGIVVPAGFLSSFVFHAPILLVFFIVYADELLKAPAAFHCYRKYTWVRDLTKLKKTAV